MPTRYRGHPHSVAYGETKPRGLTNPSEDDPLAFLMNNKERWEQQPKREQAYMEETYIPDLQSMLERQALIQAMEDQQLPDEQLQNFATREMLRDKEMEMPLHPEDAMYNLPEYIPWRYSGANMSYF